MEYSMNELLCYNSLLDGKKIQGIRIIYPSLVLKKQIVDKTLKELKEKNLIDESGRQSKLGAAKLHIIRLYKEAHTYIAINKVAAALKPNGKMIMAVQTGKEKIQIESGERAAILLSILKTYPFLCEESKEECIKEGIELSESKWNEMSGRISMQEAIVFQKMYKGEQQHNIVIFRVDNKLYKYDYLRKKLYESSTRKLRMELIELLELGEIQNG